MFKAVLISRRIFVIAYMLLTCCWSVGARDLWGGSVLVKTEISSDKVAFLTFKLSCDGSQATGHDDAAASVRPLIEIGSSSVVILKRFSRFWINLVQT